MPSNLPTTTSSNGWVPAKFYRITPQSRWQKGDLEAQWSACNGIDGFGHVEEDKELNAARRRHGECLDKLPGCPRLILFRPKKDADLIVKLWYIRTLQSSDDVHGIYASLAKALVELGPASEHLSVDLIDWDANRPEAKRSNDDRYELSIELCGLYLDLPSLRKVWRKFMTHFEGDAWE